MTRLLLLLVLLGCAAQAPAVNICVDTATELRSAMTAAASNGEDDRILVKTGTYAGAHPVNGSTAFIVSLEENFGLSVQGGWVTQGAVDCGRRLGDPTLTVLHGAHLRTVVLIIGSASSGTLSIENLAIEAGETDGRGGGIDQVGEHSGTLRVERVYFFDNHAEGFAAGASLRNSGRIELRNNLFLGNRCGNRFCAAEVSVQSDDVLTVRTLVGNNTVVANSCDGGSGSCEGTGIGVYGSARAAVYNNAFAFNDGVDLDIASAIGQVAVLHNNLLQMSGTPTSESGNLAIADPLFVSLLGLDFRLRDNSPLRDAGSAEHAPGTYDFHGLDRINGAHVDIGAFENNVRFFADGFETPPP